MRFLFFADMARVLPVKLPGYEEDRFFSWKPDRFLPDLVELPGVKKKFFLRPEMGRYNRLVHGHFSSG